MSRKLTLTLSEREAETVVCALAVLRVLSSSQAAEGFWRVLPTDEARQLFLGVGAMLATDTEGQPRSAVALAERWQIVDRLFRDIGDFLESEQKEGA